MPGLPFGAAQQHSISAEFQTYEGIAGIEFIDMRPDLPYPRSVAYRRCADGAQMRVRDGAAEIAEVDLDEQQARAYLSALVEHGLFRWHRSYRPAQGTFVLDAPQWRLEVTFDKLGGKRCKPFRAEGEGTYPDNFEEVAGALMAPGAHLADGEEPTEESAAGPETDGE